MALKNRDQVVIYKNLQLQALDLEIPLGELITLSGTLTPQLWLQLHLGLWGRFLACGCHQMRLRLLRLRLLWLLRLWF